jgi:hypothetical protein
MRFVSWLNLTNYELMKQSEKCMLNNQDN